MADSELVQRLLALSADVQMETGEDLLNLASSAAQEVEEYIELGRLNWSPRKNWVEIEGGLPRYIERVAIGIMKGSGLPRERAIPIAISRIKVWATGKGVNADTQARAIKALAEWEKLKAKAAARRVKNKVK